MTQVKRVFITSIGEEFSAVWYTSLSWTGWFGTKISFWNLFVLLFCTKNLLYWEELGYHMLVSYSVYFNGNLCSCKVSIRLLDITAGCINSSRPRVLGWNPLRGAHSCHQEWFQRAPGASFWLIRSASSLLLWRLIHSGALLLILRKKTLSLTIHSILNNRAW